MSVKALSDELAAIADARGIDKIGVCSADVFTDVREALHARKAAGLSADMQFTYRNPDRATDPRRSLPDAETIVVCARSYRRTAPETTVDPTGTAAIAEYVWEPHYAELRFGLDAIATHLRNAGWSSRVLMDDNALVDRAAAYRAGIGWWGKNSNILVPGVGSKFVLGSVVTNAPLAVVDEPLDDQCGPCRRCIDACPTDAIVDDGVIGGVPVRVSGCVGRQDLWLRRLSNVVSAEPAVGSPWVARADHGCRNGRSAGAVDAR